MLTEMDMLIPLMRLGIDGKRICQERHMAGQIGKFDTRYGGHAWVFLCSPLGGIDDRIAEPCWTT